MQQTRETAAAGGTERKRVEAVVETLATLHSHGESVAEVAHDARNMVTALGLYCDLLEEPGVLASPFTHYGTELRLVAAASRRLVEKLVALDTSLDTNFDTGFDTGFDPSRDASFDASFNTSPDSRSLASPAAGPETGFDAGHAASLGANGKLKDASRSITAIGPDRTGLAAAAGNPPQPGRAESRRHETHGRWDLMPAALIDNLAAELLANRNLLAALAGPSIALTMDAEGGSGPVRLTGEDLTRVLVNLVKNAAEAMPAGGRIQIGLRARAAAAGAGAALALTIEDNGPGIPEGAQDEIFASGYTTRARGLETNLGWPAAHRGLGLSITRSIVEAAGGHIVASNRAVTGACFEIELPVRGTSD